jgi:branched-chain amino acid transport system substrate-binding protein
MKRPSSPLVAVLLAAALAVTGCGSQKSAEEAAQIRAERATEIQDLTGGGTVVADPQTGAVGGPATGTASGTAPANTGAAAPEASAPGAGTTTSSGTTPTDKQDGADVQSAQRPGGAAGGAAKAAVNGPGVTDTEILLGLTGPLSGVFGFYGQEMIAGADAYAKTVNAAGGISGRQIRIVSYDDRFEPAQVLSNVKRLVEQDKVFAMFSLWSDAALPFLTQKGIPVLTLGVTAPTYSSKYPTVFPLQNNILTWNEQLAEAVTQHMNIRPKKVGIIYDTGFFDGRPYTEYFKQTWEEFGAQVTVMEPLTLSDGDCTSVALKMRNAGIDFWDFETLAWPLCVGAMDRLGWRPPMGMGGWPASAAGVATIVGPSVKGIIAMNLADQPDGKPRKRTAAHAAYEAALKKYYPSIGNKPGSLESSATLAYYIGMQLLTDALKSIAPTFTREALVTHLQGIKKFETGISPPINSLAPTCKQGSGQTWWAPWEYDPVKRVAFRSPATPYVGTDRFEKRYGDACFVTKIADRIVGAGG